MFDSISLTLNILIVTIESDDFEGFSKAFLLTESAGDNEIDAKKAVLVWLREQRDKAMDVASLNHEQLNMLKQSRWDDDSFDKMLHKDNVIPWERINVMFADSENFISQWAGLHLTYQSIPFTIKQTYQITETTNVESSF